MEQNTSSTDLYIQSLENRIARLEEQISRFKVSQPQLPDTALVNQSFLKRAFAVWGHYFVAQLLIAIPIWCFVFALGMLANL